MSYQESWFEKHYPIVIIMGCLIPGIIVLSVIQHDSQIDSEEWDFKIHQNDSCDELFQALEYENRKILKDQSQVKVLTNFIMEKNC